MKFSKKVDLSAPKRKYFSDQCELNTCPECGGGLVGDSCTILLDARSTTDEASFMTNATGSQFCLKCPVAVFDRTRIEQAARVGIREDENLEFGVAGIIDLDSVPKEKQEMELGIEGNPIPLVDFLPPLNTRRVISMKRAGRNDPCPCGSGKKYKKCCIGKL